MLTGDMQNITASCANGTIRPSHSIIISKPDHQDKSFEPNQKNVPKPNLVFFCHGEQLILRFILRPAHFVCFFDIYKGILTLYLVKKMFRRKVIV
jgi:hypothetical protein